MANIRLTDDDPTVFMTCPVCTAHGPGKSVMSYFGSAYTIRKAKRAVCPNCKSVLVERFRVKSDGRTR